MIDWVTIRIPFEHDPIASGRIVSITADGEPEWESAKRVLVEGSHSATISVRSGGSAVTGTKAAYLSISGNPSKFLQGHNLFGSDDLLSLVYDMVKLLDAKLELGMDELTLQRVKHGEYHVSCVDINYSYTLSNQTDVMAWIHAAEFMSRSRSGRPTAYPGTIYWGQHSRKHCIKAYSKLNELTKGGKEHSLDRMLGDYIPKLLEWAENILRIELRLLTTELKKLGLSKAADLAPKLPALYAEYQGRILMNENRRIQQEKLLSLPTKLRSTYTLWAEGHHMASMLAKATFYRHRKLLLEHGIDISMTCANAEETSNVVPFVRVLEAKPAQVPTWAYANNLVHRSAYAR